MLSLHRTHKSIIDMFDFKPFPKETFKRNFLRTVVFQLQYPSLKGDILKEYKIVAEKYFLDKLPRIGNSNNTKFSVNFTNNETPIVRVGNDPVGLVFKSEKGDKQLQITNNAMTYTIMGVVYTDFDTLKNDLATACDFLNEIGVDIVSRIGIRKVNIIGFNTNNPDPTFVLKEMLSPEILSNMGSFPTPEKIKNFIQTISYNANNYQLNINYGLSSVNSGPVVQGTNTLRGTIIIDIDLLHIENSQLNQIWPLSDEINTEIFNVFNWAISNNARNILRGNE